MAMVRNASGSTEVEETMKRIQSHRGVKGVLICTSEVRGCSDAGEKRFTQTAVLIRYETTPPL